MLAKVSAFMSIIFIVQTQIIKRTEEGTYGRWIRSTCLNHLVLKMSCVAAICKEGLGTLVFQNQFPLERVSCSGSYLVQFVEITFSLYMYTYLVSFCLHYSLR